MDRVALIELKDLLRDGFDSLHRRIDDTNERLDTMNGSVTKTKERVAALEGLHTVTDREIHLIRTGMKNISQGKPIESDGKLLSRGELKTVIIIVVSCTSAGFGFAWWLFTEVVMAKAGGS